MAPINLNVSRFVLPEAGLRALRVVTAAMIAVVTTFAAAVLVLAEYADPAPGQQGTDTLLGFLSLMHVVIAGTCYAVAGMLFTRTVRRPADPDAPPGEAFVRLRGALIVRLALIETPATMGLMICLLGALWGVLRSEPAYWLNLFSTAVFLLFAVRTFPTRSGIEYLLSAMGTN